MIEILRRLFGKKPNAVPLRDVATLTAGIAVPAVHLRATDIPSRSHFGGSPNLPADMPWPEADGRKLAFLARLSLGEIQSTERIDWLPETGALLFFYDIDEQPWGFDPKHGDRWAVLLAPELPQPISRADSRAEDDSEGVPFRNIGLESIEVIPSAARDSVRNVGLTDREIDSLFDVAERAFGGRPKHQVAGVPAPIQSDDMELECQLVSNGLYCGDTSGYEDPRAEALGANADNWKLLLQFDTDDDLGVMWGDGGTLYYWVESEAARARDFRRTWLILQCF